MPPRHGQRQIHGHGALALVLKQGGDQDRSALRAAHQVIHARAQALVRQCGNVVCCLDLFGPVNEKNRVLRDWAQREGLLRSKSKLENIT